MSVTSWVVAPQWHHSPSPSRHSATKLLHHRQHRIADARGLPFKLNEIDLAGVAMVNDFFGGILRDDAEPRLRPRQRRFEVEVLLHAVFIGKHPPHGLGGEDVAEYGGVDCGGGHAR